MTCEVELTLDGLSGVLGEIKDELVTMNQTLAAALMVEGLSVLAGLSGETVVGLATALMTNQVTVAPISPMPDIEVYDSRGGQVVAVHYSYQPE